MLPVLWTGFTFFFFCRAVRPSILPALRIPEGIIVAPFGSRVLCETHAQSECSVPRGERPRGLRWAPHVSDSVVGRIRGSAPNAESASSGSLERRGNAGKIVLPKTEGGCCG